MDNFNLKYDSLIDANNTNINNKISNVIKSCNKCLKYIWAIKTNLLENFLWL